MKMSIPAKPTLLGPAQRLQHKATSKKDGTSSDPHKAFPLKSEVCNLLDHFLTCQSVNYCQFRKKNIEIIGGNSSTPVFDQTKTLLWTIWNDYKITFSVGWLFVVPLRDWGSQTTAKHCVATRARWRLLDFHLWSATSLANVCLGSTWMDGWMDAQGLQNFPLEILRYHLFWCERYTVEYLLFFGGRRGKEAGCNCRWSVLFSATFRDLRCRILRWSGGALREKRQIQLVGWWCSRTGKLAAANVSFLTMLLREDIDGHIVDLPLTQ